MSRTTPPDRAGRRRPRPPSRAGRSQPGAAEPRRLWPSLLAIALFTFALHARSARFDFVYADDVDLIQGNAAFLGSLANLPRAFTRSYFETENVLTTARTYYRPLAIASFMADYRLGGGEAAAFHATNVLLHGLAAGLLFALAARLGATRGAALAVALVFVVHPLNAQAVYWIAGRNELLFAVFALASWLALVEAQERQRLGWHVVHAIAFFCALLSKETAVVLPPLFVLFAWSLRRQDPRLPAPRDSSLQPRLLAGWAAAYVAWAALRANALGWGFDPGGLAFEARTLISNLAEPIVALGKFLAPVRLNVAPGIDITGVLLGLGAAVALLLPFARVLTWREQLFVWGGYLLCYLPSLVVPDLPAYEHRAYVPGAVLLAGLALAASRAGVVRPAWARAVTAAVVAALSALTWARGPVFADPFSYWTDAARDRTFGPMAHVNLGQLFERVDRLDEAEQAYRRALALDPRARQANNNLGVVMMKRGRTAEGVALFERELSAYPNNADALFNLGLVAAQQGERDRAIALWERVVAVNRAYVPAYRKLAEAYRAIGDPSRAASFEATADALERPPR